LKGGGLVKRKCGEKDRRVGTRIPSKKKTRERGENDWFGTLKKKLRETEPGKTGEQEVNKRANEDDV